MVKAVKEWEIVCLCVFIFPCKSRVQGAVNGPESQYLNYQDQVHKLAIVFMLYWKICPAFIGLECRIAASG